MVWRRFKKQIIIYRPRVHNHAPARQVIQPVYTLSHSISYPLFSGCSWSGSPATWMFMLTMKRRVSSTIGLFEADPEVRNKFWVILRVNTIIKESYKNAHKNNMNISKLVYVITYSFPRCRYGLFYNQGTFSLRTSMWSIKNINGIVHKWYCAIL